MEFLSDFKPLDPYKLSDNIFDLLDNQWMLITSGTLAKFNMMTASWGGFGVLWNKPIAIAFIRPQRYTYDFVEKNDYFNLTFYSKEYRKTLQFCGSKSGREFDKAKETGLTPILTPNGIVTFQQARIVIDCKKLYFGDIEVNNFIDKSLINKIYPDKDFHRFYIGEITGCYTK